jgi:hypothetical protein
MTISKHAVGRSVAMHHRGPLRIRPSLAKQNEQPKTKAAHPDDQIDEATNGVNRLDDTESDWGLRK